MKHKLFVTSATLVVGLVGTIAVARSATATRPAIPFSALSMTVEINASAPDAGILFSSDTSESLRLVKVQDPHGHTVFQSIFRDSQELGLTEMFWETAEPDIESALLAYPEGLYTVTGVAFNGTVLSGTVNLSHSVPDRPVVISPDDGEQLDIDDVVVQWVPDPRVDNYFLEIDQQDPKLKNVIFLQPGSTSFHIPAAMLQPSSAYQIGLAAVGDNGNATLVEVEFETLP